MRFRFDRGEGALYRSRLLWLGPFAFEVTTHKNRPGGWLALVSIRAQAGSMRMLRFDGRHLKYRRAY